MLPGGETFTTTRGGVPPLNEYGEFIEREERDYISVFEVFYAKLSPEKRKALHAVGIHGPVVDFSSTAELDQDAADTPAASYSTDPAVSLDKLSENLAEKFSLRHSLAVTLASYMIHTIDEFSISYKAQLLGIVCGEILNAKNTKLCVAGLAFASNLASLRTIKLKSQRGFAKMAQVSPAAVSKWTKRWQEVLHLPTSPHMKDLGACETYALVQSSEAHWRRQKATASKLRKMREDFDQNGRG